MLFIFAALRYVRSKIKRTLLPFPSFLPFFRPLFRRVPFLASSPLRVVSRIERFHARERLVE